MAISVTERAERAWRKIQRKPIQVRLTRPRSTINGVITSAVLLPWQTVRINSDNRASVVEGDAGAAPMRAVVIYGIVGHPTLPDNDLAEGYTFVLGNDRYRIHDIIEVPGAIQALAIATG